MKTSSEQPEFRPVATPGIYRALAAVAGPLEKILGITCRDFTQLASAKLDRSLTLFEGSRYLLHRLVCSLCRKQERRMRQLNRLAGDVLMQAGSDATVKLDAKVRARIAQRVLEEIKSASKT